MNSINFRRIKGMERNFRRIFTFFQLVVPIVNGDRSSSPIIFKQVKPHNYKPGLKFVSLDLKVIFSARSRIKDCRFHRSPPRELSLISPLPVSRGEIWPRTNFDEFFDESVVGTDWALFPNGRF